MILKERTTTTTQSATGVLWALLIVSIVVFRQTLLIDLPYYQTLQMLMNELASDCSEAAGPNLLSEACSDYALDIGVTTVLCTNLYLLMMLDFLAIVVIKRFYPRNSPASAQLNWWKSNFVLPMTMLWLTVTLTFWFGFIPYHWYMPQ